MRSNHTSGLCHRCGRSGHVARECSVHVCFRCNGRGHMAWECVEGVTCSRCGERGHLKRNCKNVSCHKCGRKGHISKFCNDPFVKAEEVERNERHQAFLKSRVTSGQGNGKDGPTSPTETVSGFTGSQMVAPGPWDGLGNLGRDRILLETQATGVRVGKPGTNRSQSGMLGNVKILTVKRKIYPEANTAGGPLEGAKRRLLENCSNVEADMGRSAIATLPFENTLKVDEPPEWTGLLGYGSDDSRDDSSDRQSEEQNCHLQENVQVRLESYLDEINGTTGLQSSVEKMPTDIDERNGSATGPQSIVEQEPSSIDERNRSAISEQSGVEQESRVGTIPEILFQVHVKDVSQGSHVSVSLGQSN